MDSLYNKSTTIHNKSKQREFEISTSEKVTQGRINKLGLMILYTFSILHYLVVSCSVKQSINNLLTQKQTTKWQWTRTIIKESTGRKGRWAYTDECPAYKAK